MRFNVDNINRLRKKYNKEPNVHKKNSPVAEGMNAVVFKINPHFWCSDASAQLCTVMRSCHLRVHIKAQYNRQLHLSHASRARQCAPPPAICLNARDVTELCITLRWCTQSTFCSYPNVAWSFLLWTNYVWHVCVKEVLLLPPLVWMMMFQLECAWRNSRSSNRNWTPLLD